MSTMIERVACAIWTENYGRHRPEGKNKWPDDVIGGSQDLFRSAARAAIKEMREPTPALHKAANSLSVYYDDFSCGDGNITLGIASYPQQFNTVWSTLINAALNEEIKP